jgi:NhaP-type Na+/H+ or K+/H+ antiporter
MCLWFSVEKKILKACCKQRSERLETAPIIIFVGVLVFVAHWLSGVYSRKKLPDVLLLILIGLVLGPVLHVVRSEDFGAVGPVFVTIALVIILFEGGIGMRPEVLRTALRGTLTLTVTSFLVTMVAVGLVTHFTTAMDWIRSLMLGAILGGTSSAVVVPLVRLLKMDTRSSTILMLESALTDVLCIIVALGFLEAYVFRAEGIRVGPMIGRIIASFLLAAGLGLLGALGWSILLRRARTLQYSVFTTPAFVFVVFGVVEMLGFSGAIAALAFGITIGNTEVFNIPFVRRYMPREPIALNETERVIFAEVGFLLKTFFFVFIGISIQLNDFWSVFFGLLITAVIFILRIPVVRFSVEKTIPVSDASIMATMVPKGLAAAVLASIPLQRGIEGGEFIQNVTYAVVFLSIVVNSLLIFLLEKTPLGKFYNAFFYDFGQSVGSGEPPSPPPAGHSTDNVRAIDRSGSRYL